MTISYMPLVRPFRSAMSHFRPFFKCTQWPQMTLTCSRSEIPCYMYPRGQKGQKDYYAATYTPNKGPHFCPFALWCTVFELRPNFEKSAPNDPIDLNMFKVKGTHMHATCIPGAQIFIRFALWWAVFELHPSFQKAHLMTWHDLDMFEAQNINMNATYTPEA